IEASRSIDEEEPPPPIRGFVEVHDQHARWDAGAVEEVGRKLSDRFDDVRIHQLAPDCKFGPAAKEDAVREYHRESSSLVHRREHVLQKGRFAVSLWGQMLDAAERVATGLEALVPPVLRR